METQLGCRHGLVLRPFPRKYRTLENCFYLYFLDKNL